MSDFDINSDDGEAFVREDMQQLEIVAESFENPHVPGFYIQKNKNTGKDGVYALSTDPKKQDVWLGDVIYVTAFSRDSDADGWGKKLEFSDADGNPKTWIMPADALSSSKSEWHGILIKKGWNGNFSQAKKFAYYLTQINPSARILDAKKSGWSSDGAAPVFVLPDKVYGNQTNIEIQIDAPVEQKSLYKTKGTLAEWQDMISLAEGSPRVVFAVCVALAGPFLYHVKDSECGGFHIVGDSSKGKTTTAKMAVSVWSDWNFHLSWRTTDNGAEGSAAMRNDTFFMLDEIKESSPRACSDMLYMLSNQRGKTRAKRDGSTRTAAQWRLMVLSTGERTIQEHLALGSIKMEPGQEVRMIGIPADTGKGNGIFEDLHGRETAKKLVSEINIKTQEAYGTAGRALIEAICADPDVGMKITEIRERFIIENTDKDTESTILRIATQFGFCAAAGEYAIENGILPFPHGSAYNAAMECFKLFLEERGGEGSRISMNAIDIVTQFIEQYGSSRFENINTDENTRPAINRAGFLRNDPEKNRTEFIFLPKTFENEVLKGCGKKVALKALKEAGLLVTEIGRNTTKRDLPQFGKRKRVYVICLPEEPEFEPYQEEGTPF